MPTTHTLYRASFEPFTVTIPDRCPRCGADFSAHGALIESNWVDGIVSSHVAVRADPPAPSLEPEGFTDYGDQYHPAGVACAHCDWLLDDETAPLPVR
jgi:hypothetical protein